MKLLSFYFILWEDDLYRDRSSGGDLMRISGGMQEYEVIPILEDVKLRD